MLDRFFEITSRGSTPVTELRAGFTTFLAMSYIIVVNSDLMAKAGIDRDAAVFATCVSACVATAAMGLIANLPMALAPGMGINIFFTYTIVQQLHWTWPAALGAVFISGAGFLVLSATGATEWLSENLSASLKRGIVVGIGLFIGCIGLQQMGLVVPGDGTTSLLRLGDISSPKVLLSALTLAVMVVMLARGYKSHVIVGIVIGWLIGIPFGLSSWPDFPFSPPPSPLPTLGKLDIVAAWHSKDAIFVVLTLFLVTSLDNTSTLQAVGKAAGLEVNGHIPHERRALILDGSAPLLSSWLGTSSTMSFVESLVGITVGGRTGLAAIATSVFFAVALLLTPVVTSIPTYATAPALILAAIPTFNVMRGETWQDPAEYVPAIVIALIMPFTFSIVSGIGAGCLVYTIMKMGQGRFAALKGDPAMFISVIWLIDVLSGGH